MIEALINTHERRVSQRKAINDMPLYPDEVLFFFFFYKKKFTVMWLSSSKSGRVVPACLPEPTHLVWVDLLLWLLCLDYR
jgi:hypothetical protein